MPQESQASEIDKPDQEPGPRTPNPTKKFLATAALITACLLAGVAWVAVKNGFEFRRTIVVEELQITLCGAPAIFVFHSGPTACTTATVIAWATFYLTACVVSSNPSIGIEQMCGGAFLVSFFWLVGGQLAFALISAV